MEDSKLWTDEPARYIVIACRLCGDVWKFPIQYKDVIKEGWECPNCRRKWREIHGRDAVKY